jgi:hypothetical protein
MKGMGKKKKVGISGNFILLFLSFLIFSCSSRPEDIVEEYLELTYKKNNARKAYELLSKDDRKFKSEEEFILDHKRKNILNEKLKKKYVDKFSFQVEEIRHDFRDTVKVKAVLYKPGSSLVLNEMLIYAMASTAGLEEAEKEKIIQKYLDELANQEDSELEAEEKEFTLIRENGEYKLFFNFGKPYREKILEEQISALEEEAKDHLRKLNYEKARMIYKQMYSLKKDESTLEKLRQIDELICSQLHLGIKKDIGKISLKPLKVEVKNILL